MKPFRQIEAAEMMLAANKFTSTYAEMILATTRADGLVDGAKPKKKARYPRKTSPSWKRKWSGCAKTAMWWRRRLATP